MASPELLPPAVITVCATAGAAGLWPGPVPSSELSFPAAATMVTPFAEAESAAWLYIGLGLVLASKLMLPTAGLIAFCATQLMPLMSSASLPTPPHGGGPTLERTLYRVTPVATPNDGSPETDECPPIIEAILVPCPLQSIPFPPVVSAATEARFPNWW